MRCRTGWALVGTFVMVSARAQEVPASVDDVVLGAKHRPVLPGHQDGNVVLHRATGQSPLDLESFVARLRSEHADSLEVVDLLERVDALWPRHPRMVPGLERWLEDAKRLTAGLPDFEESLRQVQELALADQESSRREPPFGGAIDWERADPLLRARFGVLQLLLSGITKLAGNQEPIRRRLISAQELPARSVEAYQDEWDQARTEISTSPLYGGLDLPPQVGLVPIGADPGSGLWEFWHVDSGSQPSGIVLVLVPGGTYDELARDNESPVHSATLGPYFLAETELTVHQATHLLDQLDGQAPPELEGG